MVGRWLDSKARMIITEHTKEEETVDDSDWTRSPDCPTAEQAYRVHALDCPSQQHCSQHGTDGIPFGGNCVLACYC